VFKVNLPSRSGAAVHFLVLFLLFALQLLLYPGLFSNFTNGFIGGFRGDAGIYVYLTLENIKRVLTWPSQGFDLDFFYPYGRSLAFTDSYLFPSLLAKPLLFLSGNLSLAYNSVIMISLVLNGYCTFLLARRLTESFWPALFAGMAFMLHPFFEFHRGHPQLQHAWFLPMILLCTINFLERRKAVYAFSLGALIYACFLSSVYFGMFSYLLAGSSIAFYVLLKRASLDLRIFIKLLVCNLPWLFLLYFSARPYAEVRAALGEMPTSIMKMHSLSAFAYLAAPITNLTWGSLTHHLSHMEGYLFSGLLVTVLALFSAKLWYPSPKFPCMRHCFRALLAMLIVLITYYGIFQAPSASLPLHHYAWAVSLFLWCTLIAIAALASLEAQSSEPTLSDSERAKICLFLFVLFFFISLGLVGSAKVHLPFPELYRLVYYLPGYNSLRAVGRVGIVACLLLTQLAAFGLREVLRAIRNPSLRPVAALPILLLLPFELRLRGQSTVSILSKPKVYESLASLSDHDAAIALPMRSADDGRNFLNFNTIYMRAFQGTGHPFVNGYSGKMPEWHQTEGKILDSFPSEEALQRMGSIVGLRYVVLNKKYCLATNCDSLERLKSARNSAEFKLLFKDRRGNMLFKLDPVLKLNLLPGNELLLKPDTHSSRLLKLELRLYPKNGINQSRITFNHSAATASEGLIEEVEVNAGEWLKLQIKIPPSSNSVLPQSIKVLSSNPEAEVLIRNIELLSPENL